MHVCVCVLVCVCVCAYIRLYLFVWLCVCVCEYVCVLVLVRVCDVVCVGVRACVRARCGPAEHANVSDRLGEMTCAVSPSLQSEVTHREPTPEAEDRDPGEGRRALSTATAKANLTQIRGFIQSRAYGQNQKPKNMFFMPF